MLKDLRFSVLRLLSDLYNHEKSKEGSTNDINFLANCKREAEKANSKQEIADLLNTLKSHPTFEGRFFTDSPSMYQGKAGYTGKLQRYLQDCKDSADLAAAKKSLESARIALSSSKVDLYLNGTTLRARSEQKRTLAQ
ncbi:hypothetical protein [Piscirickettsia salmonis]|uniref:hypothetical protein n=1 Tax=Piscirickettsia salmonis TaxID=1238 RepID=UPI001E5A9721|nr:hypothetical protein [Piscirickettsia salmonis]